MAGVENSQEVEVSELTHGTCGLVINCPRLVFLSVEVSFASPLGSLGPGLATTPVADKVLVAGVYKDFKVGVVKHPCNLGHKISHPVTE
jgi:hypothetical protein